MIVTRTTGSPGRAPAGRTAVTRTVTATPARPAPQRTYVETAPMPSSRSYVEKSAAPAGPAAKTVKAAARPAPPTRHAAPPSRPATAAKPAKRPPAKSETASRTTTDHEAIRKWAERRGGHPTSVMGTEHGKEAAGVLRLDFGVKDEKLHPVDWQAFFDKFEESHLAFLHQDKTSGGKMSRFYKFIQRH